MNLWFIGLNIAKWTLLNYFKGTISVSFLPDFRLGYQDEDGIDPIFCKLFLKKKIIEHHTRKKRKRKISSFLN